MRATHGVSLCIGLLGACTAAAQEEPVSRASVGVFELGQITVSAPRLQEADFADAVVSNEEMWAFDVGTLAEAMKLLPGVSATLDSNGRRNERDILVRGYGRWQVPLSIDGVRVYLPADNRLDFNRFLTQDLAEVQVQKGYASVLDGPGGLGGAINLVTRTPSRAFESSFQSGAEFRGGGEYDGWSGAASIGTRQERFYALASGSYLDREQMRLSEDFQTTAIEDGGARNGSDNRDWRINVKAGYTPNDADEYSLSYTSQSGEKGAPLNVFNNPPNPPNSYWRWPYWDIENLYFLSRTQLGEGAYLKTRAFYNQFDNALFAYDDATYTTQSAPGRFRSYYDDEGYGGSVEAGVETSSRNTLRAAFHYRRDEHSEYNDNRPTNPALRSIEPVQRTEEETWSLALENTLALSQALEVVAGVSYDRNELKLAQDFSASRGLFAYPTGEGDALNGQARVRWRYASAYEVGASVSSRTRFPTIFERFSTRFGTALPNPELETERGANFELSWNGQMSDALRVAMAAFYNNVSDMIQTVVIAPGPPQLTQTQNVGDGEYYGLELSADARFGSWRVGGNYTWLEREISDPLRPALRATGTPTHQAFAFASFAPTPALTVTPSIEFADERWSDTTSGAFVKVGEYTLVGLQLDWRPVSGLDIAIGGRNLLDENYQLAHGFPESGRTWFAKLRLSY